MPIARLVRLLRFVVGPSSPMLLLSRIFPLLTNIEPSKALNVKGDGYVSLFLDIVVVFIFPRITDVKLGVIFCTTNYAPFTPTSKPASV